MTNLWRKFQNRAFRAAYNAAHCRNCLKIQLSDLVAARGLTQATLAERCGLSQGAISRALNPEYGCGSVRTLLSIAEGLDVALVVRFVPFSELEADEISHGDIASFGNDQCRRVDTSGPRYPVPSWFYADMDGPPPPVLSPVPSDPRA